MTCSPEFICRFIGIQVLIFLARPWKVILGAAYAMDHQLRMDFIMTCTLKTGKISVSENFNTLCQSSVLELLLLGHVSAC